VAIAPGSTFTNGPPDVEVVSLRTSQTTATTQCAGNIVVGLGQRPPARRRSSIRHSALQREVQRAHDNDLFEMDTFSRPTTAEQHRKLNRQSWLDA
jgi:hypothetical protein